MQVGSGSNSFQMHKASSWEAVMIGTKCEVGHQGYPEAWQGVPPETSSDGYQVPCIVLDSRKTAVSKIFLSSSSFSWRRQQQSRYSIVLSECSGEPRRGGQGRLLHTGISRRVTPKGTSGQRLE